MRANENRRPSLSAPLPKSRFSAVRSPYPVIRQKKEARPLKIAFFAYGFSGKGKTDATRKTTKKMQNFQRWVSPLLLALVSQQVIRLVTDIPASNAFWASPSQHLEELLLSIPLCYLLDWDMRRFLKKRKHNPDNRKEVGKEYLYWFVYLTVAMTVTVFLVHRLLGLADYASDYILAVFTIVPLLLLYYTWIRHDFIRRKFTEQQLLLERIKSEKLETELKFLKNQYHPHFLFNALNTVYFLVDDDNQPAKESIELLSDLLRYQIYTVDEPVTLEEELGFLAKYLRFQQFRMDENIRVESHLEMENKKVKIHPLLFQPLLENAFKHLGGGTRIDFYVRQEGDMLTFTTSNPTGPGGEAAARKGIGLENLRQRLALLYPGRHTLQTELKDGAFLARLTIQTHA